MIKVLVHHTITTGLLTRLFCNLFYILLALLIIFDSVSTVVYVAVVRTIAFIPAFLLVNPLMRLVQFMAMPFNMVYLALYYVHCKGKRIHDAHRWYCNTDRNSSSLCKLYAGCVSLVTLILFQPLKQILPCYFHQAEQQEIFTSTCRSRCSSSIDTFKHIGQYKCNSILIGFQLDNFNASINRLQT